MRFLKVFILVFITSSVFAQNRLPKDTIPIVKTNGTYRIGWLRNDSGYIFTRRDTFPARYPTKILHNNGKFYSTLGNGAPWLEDGTGGISIGVGGAATFRTTVGETFDGLPGPTEGLTTYTPTLGGNPVLRNKDLFIIFRNNITLRDYKNPNYEFDIETGTITVTRPFVNGETLMFYYNNGNGHDTATTSWLSISSKPVNVTTIGGIPIVNDNIIQFKSGALTGRSPSQIKSDLSITKADIGLSVVTNDIQLKAASNLADLGNVVTARTNLGLGSIALLNTIDATNITTGVLAPSRLAAGTALQVLRRNAANTALEFATISVGGGDMVTSNNLSDLTNLTTARFNLGLGTLAVQNGSFSGSSSGTNTGDETTSSIKTKLSITTLSGSNTGDQDLTPFLQKANNLSDVANAATARVNLGLGNVSNITATPSALTSGTTITWDYSTGYTKTLSLAHNATLAFTNDFSGAYYTLILTQTGSFDITVPTGDRIASGITTTGTYTIVLPHGVGDLVVLSAVRNGSIRIWNLATY